MKNLVVASVVTICLGIGLPYLMAGPITIESAEYHTYQQTTNNPCVIGNPSCNEPAGFTYYQDSGPVGGGGTYNLYSPVYYVGSSGSVESGNIIPSSFIVGVDDNYAAGQGFESLVAFNVYTSSSASPFPGTGGTSPPASGFALDSGNSWLGSFLINVDNGNGYADAILSGFSIPVGTYVYFQAIVDNDTDGFEQFFVVPAGTPPTEIPEPSTVVLLGAGLITLGGLARRRKS
jgi:hypothetical protein